MNDADRAELVGERDFLLRSIADLDAEQEAGDLASDDFAALRDDYVARAAAAIRKLKAVPSSPDGAPFPSSSLGVGPLASLAPRRAVALVAVLGLAVASGVALASAAGSRPAGAPLSGSLPTSTADRLAAAAILIQRGEPVEAIKLYDKILEDDPERPAALAYRGWIVRLAGLKEEGLAYVDRAVASDPSYPDAHFFRGMMLWQDKRDPAGAVEEFRLFLSNRPPQAMVALVEDALRRAAAEAGITAE